MLTALTLALFAATVALASRLRTLARRIEALERTERPLPAGARKESAVDSPLQGLRLALAIQQDHPHPVFATLLKEALLREGALIDDRAEVTIQGTLACNGYADVYFRAEILVLADGETLLTFSEKPPHGDRQENLARELVARLKAEWPKRERRGALRELGA